MSFARVAVDIPSRQVSSAFDYEIPAQLRREAIVGTAVLVDFGPRPAVGWIIELTDTTDARQTKPIRAVISESFFDDVSARIAMWMAEEYVAPLADALRLFLPPGASPRAERLLAASGNRPAEATEAAVWDAAAESRRVDDLAEETGLGSSDLERLVRRGVLRTEWRLKRAAVAPVEERWAVLREGFAFEPSPRATLQRAVLDALAAGPVSVAELRADLGGMDGALRRLADVGAIELIERRRYRSPSAREKPAERPDVLSKGQMAGLSAIDAALDARAGSVLLDGVTGSGKTEVYLRAIERVLAEGGSAVVLVPEISLTPQTVGRFRTRFGTSVALLHSRLSTGERRDEWDRLRSGDARVVVGARSALFAPLPSLELIVIDEEHETSYKQGSAPRYVTRDVAEHLAAAREAVLVAGSATPSMEAQARAEAGSWTRVALRERVAGGALPDVEVVDMAAEFAAGHRSMFSRALMERLGVVREQGSKAVLLLNRRGFASFLLCRECGYVPGCDECSISLTYHERGRTLACHHCGHRRPVPPNCPNCGSPYLRMFGAGTQRVEAELAAALPGLPVVRMDSDTTSGKGGHERRLAEFEAQRSGVLLGTQMVAKGLDYPEVSLVGVLNADTTLHLPDFRAAERTYQMLAQVSGRAGRGALRGHVVIQTYWPDHPAIRAAASHDPEPFYASEEAVRRELRYPPFGRLANIVVTSADNMASRDQAHAIAEALRDRVRGELVLGASPAPIARIKGSFRWHVLVKGAPDAALAGLVTDALQGVRSRRGVAVAVDIDPVDLL